MHKSFVLWIGLTGAKNKFPCNIPCMANTKSSLIPVCSLVSLTHITDQVPSCFVFSWATYLFPRCISIHGEVWVVLLANSPVFDMMLWKSVDFTLYCYLGPKQMEYFFLSFSFLFANAVWFKYAAVCCIHRSCVFLLCKAEIWKLCRCPASSNCFLIRVKGNSIPFALFHTGSPLSVMLIPQPRLLISALVSGLVYRFVVQRYE